MCNHSVRMTDQQRATYTGILVDLIEATLKADKTSFNWDEVLAFYKERMEVKNWLMVRGMMQELMDEGYLERHPDVHVEQYNILCTS